MAALSPGLLAHGRTEQDHFNRVAASWLQLQKDEIKEIGITIAEILTRLDLNDENIRKRIESPEYLSLLKKCFRDWSAAESEAKRILVRNLLSNAAVNKICTDDVVRMFVQWIDDYSEMHFKVIRWIYKHLGCTRKDIWIGVHGAAVREDSAEADMFKLLIRDLSTGSVIRQHREKDYYGNFFKKTRQPPGGQSSQTMKSAFDDEEEYELTELGNQFVRYTMDEVMPESLRQLPITRRSIKIAPFSFLPEAPSASNAPCTSNAPPQRSSSSPIKRPTQCADHQQHTAPQRAPTLISNSSSITSTLSID